MKDKAKKIGECKSNIVKIDGQINEVEKKIQKCEDAKKALEALKGAMENTSRGAKRKIIDISNVVNPIIKMSFFSGIMNVFNGHSYKNATSDVDSKIDAIKKKIQQLMRESEDLLNAKNKNKQKIIAFEREKED